MERHHIVLVEDGLDGCPSGRCGQLSDLLRSSMRSQEIQVQIVSQCPPTGPFCTPDLLLMRPSPAWSQNQMVGTWGSQRHQMSILGLFCGGRDGSNRVVQALHKGLEDFLICPFKEVEIASRIHALLDKKKTSDETPASGAAGGERTRLKGLVGESPCFLRTVEKIPLLAHSDATVLITGETGTGKDLFARAIHYQGSRQGGPFIPVNCGALPDQLFENELFGHARGAFTNAVSPEQGLVAEAEGGTLFLDEVETLSPLAQIKLLRFLQEREYRPLGSSKSRVANVRIIAATNADLGRRVHEQRFRQDLYYRLNVLALSVPPLRERVEDIPLLASHFLVRYGGQMRRETLRLSASAIQKLLAYPWPGNVRELEGAVQRAAILSVSSTLQPDDIDVGMPNQIGVYENGSLREAKNCAVREFERAYLVKLLATHEGNVTRAAEAAGKDRRTMQRLLRKYQMERDSFRKCL